MSLCVSEKYLVDHCATLKKQSTNALRTSWDQSSITSLEKDSGFLLVLEPNVANDTVYCHPSM